MKGIVGDHYTMFHTVAHRLELGITAAIGELVEDLESLVKDLYKHYQNSPKQKAGLKRIAEVLGTYDPVAFIGLHGILWVASKVRALTNIIKNPRVFSTYYSYKRRFSFHCRRAIKRN